MATTVTQEMIDEMADALEQHAEHAIADHAVEDVARAWLEAGISPETAIGYLNVGCWDEERVAELARAGISPADIVTAQCADSIQYMHSTRYYGQPLGYVHSNRDVSTYEILVALGRVATCGHEDCAASAEMSQACREARETRIRGLCSEVAARGWAHGTERDGTLRAIVEQALSDDPCATAEDVRDVVVEAEEDR